MDESQHRPSTRQNTNVNREGEAERKTDVLERERARLDIRGNFFTVRVVKQWNDLPENIKNSRSVNAFKNAYDAWTRNKPNLVNSQ